MLLSEHGETITVTPFGGSPAPTNITAVVEWTDLKSEDYDYGREAHKTGTVLIDPTAIPSWVPNEEGDTFTIEGTVYALVRVVQDRPILVIEFLMAPAKRWGGADAYEG